MSMVNIFNYTRVLFLLQCFRWSQNRGYDKARGEGWQASVQGGFP